VLIKAATQTDRHRAPNALMTTWRRLICFLFLAPCLALPPTDQRHLMTLPDMKDRRHISVLGFCQAPRGAQFIGGFNNRSTTCSKGVFEDSLGNSSFLSSEYCTPSYDSCACLNAQMCGHGTRCSFRCGCQLLADGNFFAAQFS
jgi:hypothetical protein